MVETEAVAEVNNLFVKFNLEDTLLQIEGTSRTSQTSLFYPIPSEFFHDNNLKYHYNLTNKKDIMLLEGIYDSLLMVKLSSDNLIIRNQNILDKLVENIEILKWYSELPTYERVVNKSYFAIVLTYVVSNKPVTISDMQRYISRK